MLDCLICLACLICHKTVRASAPGCGGSTLGRGGSSRANILLYRMKNKRRAKVKYCIFSV